MGRSNNCKTQHTTHYLIEFKISNNHQYCYYYLKPKCYRDYDEATDEKNFDDAQTECEANGANLIRIESFREQVLLETHMTSAK